MWVAFYNEKALGDVLLLNHGEATTTDVTVEMVGDVAVVRDQDKVVGINLFDQADALQLDTSVAGEMHLSPDQVNEINQLLSQHDLDVQIQYDGSPKLVVGYVKECVSHADSDHLHVTQVQVSKDEVLQIVCGAANIAQGQYVIVAKEGAVMPSGAIIWNGALRGVKSDGMICSTRELNISNIIEMPGIWELNHAYEPGTPLEEVIQDYSK